MNHRTRNGLLEIDSANKIGFLDGREFRVSHRLSVAAATPVVLKFVSPVDFDLLFQNLSCDVEGLEFKAYRSAQGVEGGTFSTVVPIYGTNIQSTVKPYTRQVTITTGGTFTPNGGEAAVETIRLRTSGATAQHTTVGSRVDGERGLAANTYYLVFTNLTGTGTAEGVYNLIFQENP